MAAVVGFVLMSGLAIGVPLISRPAAVIPVPAAPTAVPMVEVFMPIQRVAVGSQLNPLMFKKESMSPVSVAALGGSPVKSEVELLGKYARTLILPGRPLMIDQIMDAPDNAITRKIRPGYRAVTVEVNNVTGIEGWGAPGARVDVLWVSEGPEGEQLVTTIIRNAQILSVAGKMDNQQGGGAGVTRGLPLLPSTSASSGPMVSEKQFTVTLLVTPDDGQKIFLATRSGELSLMLRGDFDGNQEANSQASFTTKRQLQSGADGKEQSERVEGVAKARRSDGSFEEWSVIEGRVWRWDQGQASPWSQ